MKITGQKSGGPQANPAAKSGLSYKKRMQNQNAQQNSRVQIPGAKKQTSYS